MLAVVTSKITNANVIAMMTPCIELERKAASVGIHAHISVVYIKDFIDCGAFAFYSSTKAYHFS